MPQEQNPSPTHSKSPPQTLEVSELRYRRLFETARDGILILDARTSKIIDSNPALSELSGYSREELHGRELADLGRVEDRGAAQRRMARLQRDGSLRYEDLPLLSKSGQPRRVEVVGSVYAEGERRVIQCSVRDLSERSDPQAAHTDAELPCRILADAIPQPVWTALPDGTLDYFNERWYEYTGMARGSINEAVWQGIIHPDEQDALRDTYMRSIRTGEVYTIEVRLRHAATGQYRWFLSKGVPVRDENEAIVQ